MKKLFIAAAFGLLVLWSCRTGTAIGKENSAGARGPENRPPGASRRDGPNRDAAGKSALPSNEPGARRAGTKDLSAGKVPEMPKDATKEHEQQFKALERQMIREQQKHLRRQTRLTRIRELAVAQDRKDIIERVDKLLSKELRNFVRSQQMMQQRRLRIRQSGGQGPGGKIGGAGKLPAGAEKPTLKSDYAEERMQQARKKAEQAKKKAEEIKKKAATVPE